MKTYSSEQVDISCTSRFIIPYRYLVCTVHGITVCNYEPGSSTDRPSKMVRIRWLWHFISFYPSVHKQLIRTIFEAHIVPYDSDEGSCGILFPGHEGRLDRQLRQYTALLTIIEQHFLAAFLGVQPLIRKEINGWNTHANPQQHLEKKSIVFFILSSFQAFQNAWKTWHGLQRMIWKKIG